MTALLAWFLSNPTVIAIGAGVIGAAIAWMRGRLSGAAAERNNQVAAEAKARDVADQVENAVSALAPDAARKELGQWGKS